MLLNSRNVLAAYIMQKNIEKDEQH